MAASLFEKLNAGQLPVVSGKNVFITAEYARASGITPRTARERLQRLQAEGRIRRVMTARNDRLANAWEYLGDKNA